MFGAHGSREINQRKITIKVNQINAALDLYNIYLLHTLDKRLVLSIKHEETESLRWWCLIYYIDIGRSYDEIGPTNELAEFCFPQLQIELRGAYVIRCGSVVKFRTVRYFINHFKVHSLLYVGKTFFKSRFYPTLRYIHHTCQIVAPTGSRRIKGFIFKIFITLLQLIIRA